MKNDTTLVYSYRYLPLRDVLREGRFTEQEYIDIVLTWHKLSMSRGKDLGYKIAVYCDYTNIPFFTQYADEVHAYKGYYNNFWDSYKFIALEQRTDNYILVDHDVIVKKAPFNYDEDIVFDFADYSRYSLYKKGIPGVTLSKNILQQYSDLGISDIIPEWTSKEILIPCTGVVKINNSRLKQLYLSRWKAIYDFTAQHNLPFGIATSIAAEFVLGCLINYHNFSYKSLSNTQVGGPVSDWHVHYAGSKKYKPNIADFNYSKTSLI